MIGTWLLRRRIFNEEVVKTMFHQLARQLSWCLNDDVHWAILLRVYHWCFCNSPQASAQPKKWRVHTASCILVSSEELAVAAIGNRCLQWCARWNGVKFQNNKLERQTASRIWTPDMLEQRGSQLFRALTEATGGHRESDALSESSR